MVKEKTILRIAVAAQSERKWWQWWRKDYTSRAVIKHFEAKLSKEYDRPMKFTEKVKRRYPADFDGSNVGGVKSYYIFSG